jgi:anti-sigma B factor antagonist
MSNPLIVRRTEESSKGVVVLHIQGRLDMSTLEEFKAVFTQEFEAGNHKIVLNLAQVNFIVSTHLGVIMSSFKTAQAKKGDLKFSSLKEEVYSIFDLLQLTTILDIHPDDKQALDAF